MTIKGSIRISITFRKGADHQHFEFIVDNQWFSSNWTYGQCAYLLCYGLSLLQQLTPTQRPAHHRGSLHPLGQRRHLPDSSLVVQRSVYLTFVCLSAF